jgi:hypothetical protein
VCAGLSRYGRATVDCSFARLPMVRAAKSIGQGEA